MTHATECLATKESAHWRSGSPVLMMAACTPVRPSMTWGRPRWSASWRSKVSMDPEVCIKVYESGFPFLPLYFLIVTKRKTGYISLRCLPIYASNCYYGHNHQCIIIVKRQGIFLGNQLHLNIRTVYQMDGTKWKRKYLN